MTRSNEPQKEICLVLRTLRHGETSRIATLYGETLGKFSVIAKGARNAKSTSITNLDPPCMIEAVVHIKSSRSIQIISQSQTIDNFYHIRNDLILTGHALAAIQLLERATQENDPSAECYSSIMRSLKIWDMDSEIDPRYILWKFQLDLFAALGFEIDLDNCYVCQSDSFPISSKNRFSPQYGAFCCAKCSQDESGGIFISGESLMILRRICKDSLERSIRLKCSKQARTEISRLLNGYLKSHQPDIGDLRTFEMLERFENPIGEEVNSNY